MIPGSIIDKLETYLVKSPRLGLFIHNKIGNRIRSVLEIACGSSRDVSFLSRSGYQAYALDIDRNLLVMLRQKNPHPQPQFINANALHLCFRDSQFDLVFHNGFFIVFENDDDILDLLKEQMRVSRRYLLLVVHNRLNRKLVKEFQTQAQQDSIYSIRFFHPQELSEITGKTGINKKNIRIMKFGGIVDSPKIRGLINPISFIPDRWKSFFYRFQPWAKTERIACLIKLEK